MMAALSLLHILTLCIVSLNGMCNPSNTSCWPTQIEIQRFKSILLTSRLLTPPSPEHSIYTKPDNSRIKIRPYFILVIQSYDCKTDIINAILFIQNHSLELSILSTGHSYNGRSVGMHNNSFQINFKNNKRISFGNIMNYTTVTATSSTTLGEIYDVINSTYPHKVLIGGECHSVAVGGYTLGGGMSPISSYFGLTIDTVYSFELITANLSHIICYNNGTYFVDNDTWSNNNDLFWALKGSGGSTFGVVLNITYFLYDMPNDTGITSLQIQYPFYHGSGLIAKDVMNHFIFHLQHFSKKVNGFVLILIMFPNEPIIVFDLLYIGSIQEAKVELNVLTEYHPEWQLDTEYRYYNTFWDWSSLNFAVYFINNLIFSNIYSYENITSNELGYVDKMIDFGINTANTFRDDSKLWEMGWVFYFNLILGGKVSEIGKNEASITPKVRDAVLYTWVLMQWRNKGDLNVDDKIKRFIDENAIVFDNMSIGSYFNEDRDNRINWIESFWSKEHYIRLMDIKRVWDSEHLFTCYHCVGDSSYDISNCSANENGCFLSESN